MDVLRAEFILLLELYANVIYCLLFAAQPGGQLWAMDGLLRTAVRSAYADYDRRPGDWRICLCVRQPCQQKNGHTELFAELYYAGFADASDAGGPFVDRGSDRNGDDICPASKMGHEMGLSAETEKKTRGKAEAGDDAAADKQAIELFVRGVVAHGAADETDKPWTGERNGAAIGSAGAA